MDEKALFDTITSLYSYQLRHNDYGMVVNYVCLRGKGFIDLEQFIELYEKNKSKK